MAEPQALPPKFNPKLIPALLKEHDVARMQDLPDCPEKTVWATFYAEKKRRKNLADPTVAQEAIDCAEWLAAEGRTPGEAWSVYGYSRQRAVKAAQAEEQRMIRELRVKPSKDVSGMLDVAAVKEKYEITEYVKPVEPKPEPVVIEKP